MLSRTKGKNQRKVQQEVYDRGNSGVLGREKTGVGWMERKERRCTMCYEEGETIEHMWNGCSEMREGERKEWEKY
jgi:hypothetical protein